MLTFVLGGTIIALAVGILIQRMRRILSGESACSGCFGLCDACRLQKSQSKPDDAAFTGR